MSRELPRALVDPDKLLDAMGHAVIVTDLEGVIHLWNPAAEELYGWSAEEVIGRNIADVTVPRISAALGAEIMSSMQDGSGWTGGFIVQRKDGSTFPAFVTDTGVRDEDGLLVGIVGVSTDLRVAVTPLLAQTSDAVLELTAEGRILYVSPVATRVFGWHDDDARHGWLWDLVHPEDRKTLTEHFHAVTSSTEPAPPVEARVIRQDGSVCWSEFTMSVLAGDPTVRRVVCSVRDITERRRHEEQTQRLNAQLQEALTSRIEIEQAKGLLAGRAGLDLDTAFEAMRRHARDHNAGIHEVARQILAGRFPRPL